MQSKVSDVDYEHSQIIIFRKPVNVSIKYKFKKRTIYNPN